MLLSSSSLTLSRSWLKVICRNSGGGGGRPAGKPAFNWKEKNALKIPLNVQLNKPRNGLPKGIHLYGDYSSIEHLLDNPDTITINVDDLKTDEDWERAHELISSRRNPRSRFDYGYLFGSTKKDGYLPRRSKNKIER